MAQLSQSIGPTRSILAGLFIAIAPWQSTATATLTPSPTQTPTQSPTGTATFTELATLSSTPTPSTSSTHTPSITRSATPSPEASLTTVPTPPSTAFPIRSILINEVAWAGTAASSSDEWIELHNPGPSVIDLSGWKLSDQDDILVLLSGSVAPFSYYLLERTDDSTVANISADKTYTGSLKNGGEALFLYDPSGSLVDSANLAGGGWPAGNSGSRASMERRGGGDMPGNWASSTGLGGFGLDAAGNSILGTPRSLNSMHIATPTATFSLPTPSPSPVSPRLMLINEVAWAGTVASASDEWIELLNTSSGVIDLTGWILTDGNDVHINLSGSVNAFSYYLLERSDDGVISNVGADLIFNGSLSNGGETLWLQDPGGNIIDSANSSGGMWPAGEAASRGSMERRGGADMPRNWGTYTGHGGIGVDIGGNPIAGTPKQLNSVLIPTPTATLDIPPTSFPPRSVLINEVAWSGTSSSSSDEWIELHNPGPSAISINGWTLSDGGDLAISLAGSISAGGYFLLERTDNSTVSDIAADQIYSGNLNDSGEQLVLRDPAGTLIDSANIDGGTWPAGFASQRFSMERWGGGDIPGNWGSFTGYFGHGQDAAGNPIMGTPRNTNSLFFPTPQPTWIPGKVLINEVLIRPRHDWEGIGGVTTGDEFIELYNVGPFPVYLRGWMIDDVSGSGSKPFKLPGITIDPGAFVTLFRTRTKIALNDRGDSVRLLAPDGKMIDKLIYRGPVAANLSYGRYPDGSNRLRYDLWPTPWKPNILFVEPMPEQVLRILFPLACPEGGIPYPRLARAARSPAYVAWLFELGLVGCK